MEVGTREVRIEANGGLKLDHCPPEIALFSVRRAAAGVGTGLDRIEPYRRVIILDGAVVLVRSARNAGIVVLTIITGRPVEILWRSRGVDLQEQHRAPRSGKPALHNPSSRNSLEHTL